MEARAVSVGIVGVGAVAVAVAVPVVTVAAAFAARTVSLLRLKGRGVVYIHSLHQVCQTLVHHKQ